jgi:hypothetical protein
MSRFFRQAGDSDSESEESDEELMSSGDEDAATKPAPTAVKPAMSRFLRTAGSESSSSDSDSDDEDEDSDASDDGGKSKKSKFLRSDSEGDESDDVKRVVKSAKDKRLDEMEATGKVMDNALKINDWVAISTGNYFTQERYDYGIDRPYQSSTNFLAWFNISSMFPSLYPHFTSVPCPVWSHLSTLRLSRRRRPKKK